MPIKSLATGARSISKPIDRPISEITANPRNARTHPRRQIELLTDGIRRFGFTRPVLVDEHGMLLAGHARVEAARAAGLAAIPAITATGWSDAEKTAAALADNRLSELGDWNNEMLVAELFELQDCGIDLEQIGFAPGDMLAIADAAKLAAATPSRPPPADGGTDGAPGAAADQTPGTIIDHGPHRIAIAGAGVNFPAAITAAHLLVSAPPDGQIRWAGWSGEVAYLFAADYTTGRRLTAHATDAGLTLKYQIIWHQTDAAAHGHFTAAIPRAIVVRRGNSSGRWMGGRKQSTVWQAGLPSNDFAPLEARRRAITNHTSRGEEVFDPHGDDGLTLGAADADGRRATVIVGNARAAKRLAAIPLKAAKF